MYVTMTFSGPLKVLELRVNTPQNQREDNPATPVRVNVDDDVKVVERQTHTPIDKQY